MAQNKTTYPNFKNCVNFYAEKEKMTENTDDRLKRMNEKLEEIIEILERNNYRYRRLRIKNKKEELND